MKKHLNFLTFLRLVYAIILALAVVFAVNKDLVISSIVLLLMVVYSAVAFLYIGLYLYSFKNNHFEHKCHDK